jgi:hypothetical protein
MLSRQSRLVLDTLLPSGAHPTLKYGVFDTGFEAFWSDFERTALPSLRWGFRAALFAAIWVAPLLIRRFPPLTLYARPTCERALAAMASSHVYLLRQLFVVLKTTVGFCYGADPNVRDAIGYPRQPDDPRRKVAP